MIAELAIANAAFSVIKEAVQNSGDLMSAGQAVFKYFDSKASIQRKYEAKSSKTGNNDIEEFFALEQLRKQETELREMMQWSGRAGLWNDWLQFQREAKNKRMATARAELRASAARKEKILAVLVVVLGSSLIGILISLGLAIADQLAN